MYARMSCNSDALSREFGRDARLNRWCFFIDERNAREPVRCSEHGHFHLLPQTLRAMRIAHWCAGDARAVARRFWWKTAVMDTGNSRNDVSQHNEATESIGFPLKMHNFTIWKPNKMSLEPFRQAAHLQTISAFHTLANFSLSEHL